MKIAIDNDMIYCRLKNLIAEKEFREKRKITYKVIQDETGLSSTTIAKLLNFRGIQRIDGSTLDKLCEFFQCDVGDILKYYPDSFMEFIDDKTGEINKIAPVDRIPSPFSDVLTDTDTLDKIKEECLKLGILTHNDDGSYTWHNPKDTLSK